MNTITKISTDGKGIYRHAQTGFTIHDVNSVSEIIDMNGVIAMDMTNGTWAWMAGEDLFVEVYKRGANSLRLLAQKLLGVKYKAVYRFGVGVWCSGSKVGGNNTGGMFMHGLNRSNRTYGADIRIFGIVTNAQAGRGCSPEHLESTVQNQPSNIMGCVMSCRVPGFELTVSQATKDGHGSINGADIAFAPNANVIGRVIVAIPLQSWELFLTKWAEAMPNGDKSEVQDVIASAIAKFTTAFKSNLFTVPSVRIPLVLTSDGKAYVDANPSWSYAKTSSEYAIMRFTCLPHVPTMIDSDGWWVTNPFCGAPGVQHGLLIDSVNGLGGNFYNTPHTFSGGQVVAQYTVPYTQLSAIDGVALFKVLGGLYPRVDSTLSTHTSAMLIGRAFNQNHADQPPPAQLGNETGAAYNDRLTIVRDTAPVTPETDSWGHWNMAGQPAILASVLLDAAVNGKKFDGLSAFTNASGNVCSLLRGPSRVLSAEWEGADVLTNPEPYLRHQYA